MKSACIYTRVSSREQQTEGFSLGAQGKLLREYAARHGIEIVMAFEDVETAKTSGRTRFSEMMKWFGRNRSCRILLVEKTDRLYRNLRDAVTLEDPDIEAHRLWNISQGTRVTSFQYPDLMSWRPPKGALDSVGISNGSVIVGGLGEARPFGDRIETRTKDGSCWQWLRLKFGQSILAKQRISLKMIDDPTDMRTESSGSANKRLQRSVVPTDESKNEQPKRPDRQPELFPVQVMDSRISQAPGSVRHRTLDDLTSEAIRSGFDNQLVGSHLMDLAERPNGIELAMGYVAVVVKGRITRVLANSKKDADAKLKMSGG